MIAFHRWQSGPALVVAWGLVSSTIAPFTVSAPVTAAEKPFTIAQLFPSQIQQVTIPAGAKLPVQYSKAEKIVVLPTETAPLTLTVAKNIRSSSGYLLIPAGSEVRGKLKPAEGGSQFIAEELILTSGRKLPIEASSQVVKTTEEIQPGIDTGSVLKGAAIGAAAAAVIFGITGSRITLGKILGGAAIGAVGGVLLGKRKADVIVINPNADLYLTLSAPMPLGSR